MTPSGRALALGLVLLLLVGCGGSEQAEPPTSPTAELRGTVRLFAYEDAFTPALLGPFRRAHPSLTVETAAFASGDEAVTKLRAGFKADVVNVCVEDTPRLVELGLVQPVDTSRIGAWQHMFPSLRTLPGVVYEDQVYVVPMVGGTTGILYDAEDVPEGVASFAEMLDGRFAGRLALGSDALATIAIAALARGHTNPLDLSDADLAAVRDFLLEVKAQVRTLFRGDADVMNLFSGDEIDVAAPGYPGIANLLRKQGVPVSFTLAAEGQLTWLCGYAIAANAENLDAAYALIEHYAKPRTQAHQARTFGYLVSNTRTLDVLPRRIVQAIGLEKPEQLQDAIPYVIPDNYERWQEIWREVRSG